MKSSVGSSVGVMKGEEGVEYAKENSGLAGNFDEEVNSKSSKETKLGAQENSGAEVEHFKQLGAYMEGVQSAIGGAYKKMSDSLMASTVMIQRMNMMMEEYLCRSLLVTVETLILDPAMPQGEPELYLVVLLKNASNIPLTSVHVKAGSAQADATEKDISLALGEKTVEVVEPQSTAKFRFKTTLDGVKFYANRGVKTVVSFPSPGTGKQLQTASIHRIYYSNHCRLERRRCASLGSMARTVEIANLRALDLRAYLQLSPFDSISVTCEPDDLLHAIYDPMAASFVAYVDIVQVNPADETCTVRIHSADDYYLRLFAEELSLFDKSRTES